MTPTTRTTRILAVLAALVAMIGLAPAPAQAHPLWHCGSLCNEKNPQTFAVVTPFNPSVRWCSTDAVTVREKYLAAQGITLQLRYSPLCETVWARAYGLQQGRTYTWFFRPPGEPVFQVDRFTMNSSRNWSDMTDDHGVLRAACLGPSETTIWGCTAGY
jgi:hypothetical protein